MFGYKGKFSIDDTEGNYIPTLFTAKSKGHSIKPHIFYKWLNKRTQEPRIDIFARKKHYGFDAWGDQVDNKQTFLLQEKELQL